MVTFYWPTLYFIATDPRNVRKSRIQNCVFIDSNKVSTVKVDKYCIGCLICLTSINFIFVCSVINFSYKFKVYTFFNTKNSMRGGKNKVK